LRSSVLFFFLVAIPSAVLAQKTEEALAFEVASVKPHPSTGGGSTGSTTTGGPGTSDPGQITASNRLLRSLIIEAYGIRNFQIEHPVWMGEERFDIRAKVPPGATKHDAQIMMRNLLAERFALQIQRESRILPTYSLLVAKGGSKLKPSADEEERPGIQMSAHDHQFIATGKKQSMAKMVTWLTGLVEQPVINETGLKGDYDFSLMFDIGPDSDIRSDIFPEIQKQLGLKLEAHKKPVEMLIVVSALKVPIEN
jgi:uncharacterized protein (TIGR03435 family)